MRLHLILIIERGSVKSQHEKQILSTYGPNAADGTIAELAGQAAKAMYTDSIKARNDTFGPVSSRFHSATVESTNAPRSPNSAASGASLCTVESGAAASEHFNSQALDPG